MSDDYPAKIKIDMAILRVRNVQLLPAISNELNQILLITMLNFLSEEFKSKLLQSVVAQDLKLKIIFSQVNFQNEYFWLSNK